MAQTPPLARSQAVHDHCVILARKSFLLAWNTHHGKSIAHNFYRVLHLYSGDGEIIGPHSWSNRVVALESDPIQAIKAATRYPYGDFMCADPFGLQVEEKGEVDIFLLFDLDMTPNRTALLERWLPASKFCCTSYPISMKEEMEELVKRSPHELIAMEELKLQDTHLIFLVLQNKSLTPS